MIEAGLRNLLVNTAAITSLVGMRSYPSVLPKNPILPALVYRFVGGSQNATFTTRGMQRRRVEFYCFGNSALDADTLAAALVTALNGYAGTLSDGTILQNCDFIQEMDAYDYEALVFRRIVEFYFYFT